MFKLYLLEEKKVLLLFTRKIIMGIQKLLHINLILLSLKEFNLDGFYEHG